MILLAWIGDNEIWRDATGWRCSCGGQRRDGARNDRPCRHLVILFDSVWDGVRCDAPPDEAGPACPT